MMPGKYNISIVAGDTLDRTFTFVDANDDPKDLSGYTEIKLQMREASGSDVVAEATLTGGWFTVSGVGNNILTLTGLDMPDTEGKYRYDIQFSNSAQRHTLIAGVIFVKSQITN